uniref:Exopolysaccharide production protein YjbE n=1 Tax=Shewanella sp. (strain MR-7) TaxID=60481 RepID=Q0HWU8_SHESR
MKKTSLALIAAISMLGSVAANANPTTTTAGGTTTGGTGTGGATGTIVAGSIAAGAVVAGGLIAANSSEGNPVTTSNSTSVSSN